MCHFFFASLQSFCFGGMTGSFLCRLFSMFFFPLFPNCSFGGFVEALGGPGQRGWCIDFFVLASFGCRTGRYRLEFAREASRASHTARFTRESIAGVIFESGHHDGDRAAFILGGQPTFSALASWLFGAIQADRPRRLVGLGIDLDFDRLLTGVLAARLDGPDDRRLGVCRRGEREYDSSAARSGGQHQTTGAKAPVSRAGDVGIQHDPEIRNHSRIGWSGPGLTACLMAAPRPSARGVSGPGAARCYTRAVPTSHPRHTITETPPVREALDDLRARLAGQRIDFAELVVLGAGVKVRQLPDDAAAAKKAAGRLAEMVRARAVPIEVDAADEVKHRGLIAP